VGTYEGDRSYRPVGVRTAILDPRSPQDMLNLGVNPATDKKHGPDEEEMGEQKRVHWSTWTAETEDHERSRADAAEEVMGWKGEVGVEEGREKRRSEVQTEGEVLHWD